MPHLISAYTVFKFYSMLTMLWLAKMWLSHFNEIIIQMRCDVFVNAIIAKLGC